MSKTTAFPCAQTDWEYGILLPLVMNIIVGPTIVIKVFVLRHQLWMPICLKIILFLLHCSEKPTFLLSFIYTCDIIWPPAPFESCYLARNLKEVARACSSITLRNLYSYIQLTRSVNFLSKKTLSKKMPEFNCITINIINSNIKATVMASESLRMVL